MATACVCFWRAVHPRTFRPLTPSPSLRPLPSFLIAPTLAPTPGTYGVMKGPSDGASPRLAGFRDWIAGQVGPLPITSADAVPAAQPICTPSCVWGACVPGPAGQSAGRCQCFAGASGPACATLGPKPSDCVSPGAVGRVLLGRRGWCRCCPFSTLGGAGRSLRGSFHMAPCNVPTNLRRFAAFPPWGQMLHRVYSCVAPWCFLRVPPPPRLAVAGINLNGLSYWSTELAFVDVSKSSGSWVPHDFTS
jgi:hypothetical protein